MTEAEKHLLNRLCDAVVALLTKQQTQMFADVNGNVIGGWELAKLLLLLKADANKDTERDAD